MQRTGSTGSSFMSRLLRPGIATRVELALAALLVLLLAVVGGTLYTYTSLQRQFDSMSGEMLDNLVAVHSLGNEVESIAAFAPRLVLADSTSWLETMQLRLSDHLEWLDSLTTRMEGAVQDPALLQSLRQGKTALGEVLAGLGEAVRQRLDSEARQADLLARLQQQDEEMHRQFLLDNGLSDPALAGWMMAAGDVLRRSTAVLAAADVGTLQQEAGKLDAGNRDLLARAAALPARQGNREWYRSFSRDLASLNSGPDGVEAVRALALRHNAAVFGSLTNSRAVAEALSGINVQLMGEVEKKVAIQRRQMQERLVHAAQGVILAGLAACVCAILMVLYVRGSVSGRLKRLHRSVLAMLEVRGPVRSGPGTGPADGGAAGMGAEKDGGDEIACLDMAFGYFLEHIDRHELEIREQEQQLHRILDSAPFPILVACQDSRRILFANPEARALLVEAGKGGVGQTAGADGDAADGDAAGSAALMLEDLFGNGKDGLIDDIVRGQALRSREVTLPSPGRAPVSANPVAVTGEGAVPHGRWALLSSTPVDYGHRPATLLTLYDIAMVKKVQHELETLNRELKRSNNDLEHFAYVASHDLREPLRMVTSYLSLLDRRHGKALDDDAREFMGFALDGARRMDQMILDLLEFSRAGRQSSPDNHASADEALRQAVRNLEVVIREQQAVIDCPQNLPVLAIHDSELTRLFQNLIANAINYRSPLRLPHIRIGSELRGEFCCLSVSDNGIGIPATQHEVVFQIFRRLNPSSRVRGSGIGLAVCQRMVEARGGRIWLESEEGQGTTFYLTLPLAA